MSITEVRLVTPPNPEPAESKRSGIKFGQFVPADNPLKVEEMASWRLKTATGEDLDAEKIIRSVGEAPRHVAGAHQTALYMGQEAGARALERSSKKAIDFVLFSTSFPTGEDFSVEVAKRLGLEIPRERLINIHAACSGFGVGLDYLHKLDTAGGKPGGIDGANIMFITSENYQGGGYMVDPREEDAVKKDPGNSGIIFDDRATAAVFTYGKDLTVEASDCFSDFNSVQRSAIRMPIDYSLTRGVDEGRCIINDVPGEPREKIFQDGYAVFQTMQSIVPDHISMLTRRAGYIPDEVAVVHHQGSNRMSNALGRHLERRGFLKVLRGISNSSSNVIPDTLMRGIASGVFQKEDGIILEGFGGGLLVAGAAVKLGGRT